MSDTCVVSSDARLRLAAQRTMAALEEIRKASPDTDLIDGVLSDLSHALEGPPPPASGVLGELHRNGCAWEG
jgi:hypothetical protein